MTTRTNRLTQSQKYRLNDELRAHVRTHEYDGVELTDVMRWFRILLSDVQDELGKNSQDRLAYVQAELAYQVLADVLPSALANHLVHRDSDEIDDAATDRGFVDPTDEDAVAHLIAEKTGAGGSPAALVARFLGRGDDELASWLDEVCEVLNELRKRSPWAAAQIEGRL